MSRQPSPHSTSLAPLLEWLRSARFSTGLFCPHCSGRRIQRWGRFSGRQRYRCGDCRRTFSDLTGTPAAYIKKLEKWPAYGLGMERGESLRAAARRLGIHPSTAFRWRHRLLDGMRERDRERLAGWVELCVLSGFPESKKGQRGGLGRPARTHAAFPYAGPADRPPRSWVLVARDRQGHVVTGIVPRRRLESSDLRRVLGHRIRSHRAGCFDDLGDGDAGETVLVTNQWQIGRLTAFADCEGISVKRCGSVVGRSRPLLQIERARMYWCMLKSWVRRFRGVATRYLPNYLMWHRWLHRSLSHGSREAILRWPRAGPGGGS